MTERTDTRMLGPADVRDQRWLDEQIQAIDDGVEAVLDIARNWTEGRNLSRLHPGVSAAEYVRSRVGVLGKGIVVPLLEASNWSSRQIATVAGVSPQTVGRIAPTVPSGTVLRPAQTLGADGKLRAAVRERIREEAAESEAELREVTADWTDAQRESVQPERMRQRGELLRLIHDLNGLPDAKAMALAHRPHLSSGFVAEAMYACGWLETFCDYLEEKE